MYKGFWEKLNKPFVGLSPMDGITDAPFRYITAKYGSPDVIFTEFVAVEALIRGVERAFADLSFHEIERPVVAQLYGNDPKLFYACAQVVAELGFDGVDINMGCPAKSVQQRGAGAGLIRTPEIAKEIIEQVKKGLQDWVENGITYKKWPEEAKPVKVQRLLKNLHSIQVGQRNMLPISVKTRLGYDRPIVEEWIGFLIDQELAAITVHGRTLREAYRGNANWSEIAKVVSIAAKLGNSRPVIIGNGDVHDIEGAMARIAETGVDGVLIGRSSIGNPWVFSKTGKPDLEIQKQIMIEHAKVHYAAKDPKAFVQMRRILAEYIKGVEGASAFRSQLVRVQSPEDVEKILKNLDISCLTI